tara:strand:+ start:2691 stop:3179 length:489 start_codon:yes stop_codon:yes gene_type:complete
MFQHSFVYSLFEEHVEVDNDTKKEIKKVILKKDKYNPDMNLNSYHEENNKKLFDFINKKLAEIFKKYNVTLKSCWVQKYGKNNYHNLHTHNAEEKSFVWFIDGDKDSSPLTFYDVGYPLIRTDQILTFKFVPGTFVIFPGYLPHEVYPNKSKNRLIVSGNVI